MSALQLDIVPSTVLVSPLPEGPGGCSCLPKAAINCCPVRSPYVNTASQFSGLATSHTYVHASESAQGQVDCAASLLFQFAAPRRASSFPDLSAAGTSFDPRPHCAMTRHARTAGAYQSATVVMLPSLAAAALLLLAGSAFTCLPQAAGERLLQNRISLN